MNQLTAENLSYDEVNDSSFIKNFKSGKKISEILHEAADNYLQHPDETSKHCARVSCIAVAWALTNNILTNYYKWREHSSEFKQIKSGLKNMGLELTEREIGTVFSEINDYAKRQEARYDWLKLAALMAEEQGV